MSTARKILMNTLSQIVGKAIIGVFGIVTVKLLTTYLGKSGYGFYKSVYDFMAFFAIVADMGLYTIGVREMSKDSKKEGMVLGNIMTIRTITIVAIGFVAMFASFFVDEFKGTIAPLAVGVTAMATVFSILTGTISSVLQVHLKMEYNSLASVVGKIVSVGYLVLVAFILYPHVGCLADVANKCTINDGAFYNLFFAGVAGNLAMFAVTWYYTNRIVKVTYRFDIAFWKEVIWKALPYGLALVLNTIYFRIGSILLLVLKGKEFVGVYGVPLTMLEAAGIVPLYFMNSILPVLTRAIHNKDGKHEKIIQFAYDFLIMGSFPIVVGTYVLSYQLINLISTPEFLSDMSKNFYGSDIVLQILIFALLFSFLNSLFGYILVANNKQEKLLWRNLFGAILTVVICWLTIPIFDVRGAAFANVITEGYIAVASYYLARKYLDFKIRFGTTWKIIVSSLVMGAVIWFLKTPTYNLFHLQNKNLILLVPIGVLVYGGMLVLTKSITPEMIDMVRRKPMKPSNDVAPPTEYME
jgi:O-antigen/teichoic acid export membrane protein